MSSAVACGWNDPSITDAQLARGRVPTGKRSNSGLLKKKKNLWTWESCHNVDLNLGALQSFSNLVMCVHIDKLWNRLPQTLEKRYFFSMMISELPATVLGWMLVLSHQALSWALGDLPCVCSLWVKSSSFRYSCMTCDFHYIRTKLQVRPKVID